MEHIYVAVDGDDVGRRLEYFMLINEATSLTEFSNTFRFAMSWLEKELSEKYRGELLFSGGDNLLAKIPTSLFSVAEFETLRQAFNERSISTLSMGVGLSLRQAYFALKLAKAEGKNCLRMYEELKDA